MSYGTPPFHESSLKNALRLAASGGGLQSFGAGLGAVPRGANFGTAFLAALGGSSKAYSAAQQAAQEYALKQQQAQEAQDMQDYVKAHLAAQTKALEKPAPAPKLEPWQLPPDQQQAIIDYETRKASALAKAKGAGTEASGAGEVTLDEPTLRMAAHVYQQTGQLPPFGMGKAGATARAKILSYAAHETPGVDVAANKATYGANQQALRSLVMTRESNRAFSETARANAQILKRTLNGIPDLGVRFGNRVGRWAASQAGSPQVAAFHTALGVLTPELGRILQQGNITGGQPLTDAAKKDMKAVLSGDFTKAQFNSALDVLFQDMTNKDKSYGDQINAVKSQLRFGAPADTTSGMGAAPPDLIYDPATGTLKPYR